jgi:sialidase-1
MKWKSIAAFFSVFLPAILSTAQDPSPPLGAGERVSEGRERGMRPVECRPSLALLSQLKENAQERSRFSERKGQDEQGDLATPAAPAFSNIFISGTDGYHTYRIPALLVTKKGTLLAFCEGRRNNRHDNGDIDLLVKRSHDGGNTWSEQHVIWDDGPNTCGNPCPVVDQTTGAIWLFMSHNPGGVDARILKTAGSPQTRTVWVCKSDDDGRTWSWPTNLTATLKKPGWAWYATGPGTGIQLQRGQFNGRMVIPSCHNDDVPKGRARSHAIYSDDHGLTWHLGGTIVSGVSEAQAVELADGRLLMNMRTLQGNRRSHATSSDGGLSWTTPARQEALIEPICQGSILRYTWPEKHGKSRILFSNPAHEERRRNMTVRMSYDEGVTWPVAKTIHPLWAAYSSLAILPDMSIACLFEGGEETSIDRIILARLTLDWLTDGKEPSPR